MTMEVTTEQPMMQAGWIVTTNRAKDPAERGRMGVIVEIRRMPPKSPNVLVEFTDGATRWFHPTDLEMVGWRRDGPASAAASASLFDARASSPPAATPAPLRARRTRAGATKPTGEPRAR